MSYSTQAKELISVIIMTQRASNSDWSLLCWVLYRCTAPIVNCLLAKHTGKKKSQIKSNTRKNHHQNHHHHLNNQTRGRKHTAYGNCQASEMAFDWRLQKHVTNSASPGLQPC